MSGYMLVGEAPNAATIGRPRLWLVPDSTGIPHSANRLRDHSGLTTREFLRVFTHRRNVWTTPDTRDLELGRRTARALVVEAVAEDCEGIVVLGARAASAFELVDVEFFSWIERLDPTTGRFVRIARVPHPSGRSLWWNDGQNRARARLFLLDTARTVAEGGIT